MALIIPETRQMPSAYSPEQVRTHLWQQTSEQIPGFIIADAGDDHEAMAQAYAKQAAEFGWQLIPGAIMTHAIGARAMSALGEYGLPTWPSHSRELFWHGDFSDGSYPRTALLNQALMGSASVKCLVVTASAEEVFADSHVYRPEFTEAMLALNNEGLVEDTYFDTTIWEANLYQGQAISFTVDGPGRAVHKFESGPGVEARLCVVHDFRVAELSPQEVVILA